MALPATITSRDQIAGLAGVESSKISLLPTNTSGSYVVGDRVVFGIPSYPQSSINTSRTFLKFKIRATGADKADAVFSGASQVFNRMTLKNDSGIHLESIDNYHVFSRIMDNMKTKSQLEAEAAVSKDYRIVKAGKGIADATDYSTYVTCVHDLKSGILGHSQKGLVNLDTMRSSSGACYTLELYLADLRTVFSESRIGTTFNYEITDVSLELELLKVPVEVQRDMNAKLLSNDAVLPFKTFTLTRHDIPVSTQCNIQIANHEKDVTAVFSVLNKKAKEIKVVAANVAGVKKTAYGENDHNRFVGGRHAVVDGVLIPSQTVVTEYNFRYANRSFPLSPIRMIEDSTMALEQAMATFELKEKSPYLSDVITTMDAIPKMVSLFETSTFILAQNFKSSQDARILNGLSLASHGSPLEINIQFASPPDDLECISFLEFSQTLYITEGGTSTLNKPM